MVQVHINGEKILSEVGKTILAIALESGIYIPHLCYHMGIGGSRHAQPREVVYRGTQAIKNDKEMAYGGCGLCLVHVEGMQELCHACTTPIEDGMIIDTDTLDIQEARRNHLQSILINHPHVCLTCGLAEGCNRKLCSVGIPEEQRCCWKFGNCTLGQVAAYVGFEESIGYCCENAPRIDNNPLFTTSYDLCVNCLLCVIACRLVAGREALGFVNHGGRVIVGATGSTVKESGCRLCQACVEVCPTGALREKDSRRKKSKIRSQIRPTLLPPEKSEWKRLIEEDVQTVPAGEGVYTLFDTKKEVIQITGTDNLRKALQEEVHRAKEATYFQYEEDQMYTTRERQLIQLYMKKHGKMPPGNDEMDELF